MAEYYGKLKDSNNIGKWKTLKRVLAVILSILAVVIVISALIGIFGDTKRRDETRAIIIENSELKQQIFELSQENETLKKENEDLKKTLERNSLEAGTTLSKPEGDMSGAEETQQEEEAE